MVSNVFSVGTVDEMFSMKNTDLLRDKQTGKVFR